MHGAEPATGGGP